MRFVKVSLFLAALFLMSLPGTAAAKEQVPWLIYVYFVGSDLETGDGDPDSGGNATIDIGEIMDSDAGENVRVLVQTGGSRKWQNDFVDSKKLQIFEHRGDEELRLVESAPARSMGDPATLRHFLEFGESRYAPEHRMIIFWNHGSGPTGGVGYDELFNDDYLELSEITDAFAAVYGKENKPFEIIGYDACLMSSVTTAYSMNKWGHALIASAETEPSLGWFYTPWLDELEKNPRMSIRALGTRITDTYMEDLNKFKKGKKGILSLISLDDFPDLMLSFTDFSAAVMDNVLDNNAQISAIDRIARKIESYGSRDKSRNDYSDVIDLRQFVSGLISFAPKEARETLKAIDRAVIHTSKGPAVKGKGLSVYYPIGKQKSNFEHVFRHGAPLPLNIMYGLMVNYLDTDSVRDLTKMIADAEADMIEASEFNERYATYLDDYQIAEPEETGAPETPAPASSENTAAFLSGMQGSSGSAIVVSASVLENSLKNDIARLEDLKVRYDKDNNAFVTVPKKLLKSVSSAELTMFMVFFDKKEDGKVEGYLVSLGSDVTLEEDWDTGVFTDDIDGSWPALDGHHLPMTVVSSSDEFINYTSTVKINGALHNLVIVYDNKKAEYEIIGTQRINDHGIPDRVGAKLKPGDKITPVFSVTTLDGKNSVDYDMDTFVFRKESKIEDKDLGEGRLLFAFTFYDSFGNSAMSEIVAITMNDKDELIYQTLEELLEEAGYLVPDEDGDSDDESDNADDNDDAGDDSSDEEDGDDSSDEDDGGDYSDEDDGGDSSNQDDGDDSSAEDEEDDNDDDDDAGSSADDDDADEESEASDD